MQCHRFQILSYFTLFLAFGMGGLFGDAQAQISTGPLTSQISNFRGDTGNNGDGLEFLRGRTKEEIETILVDAIQENAKHTIKRLLSNYEYFQGFLSMEQIDILQTEIDNLATSRGNYALGIKVIHSDKELALIIPGYPPISKTVINNHRERTIKVFSEEFFFANEIEQESLILTELIQVLWPEMAEAAYAVSAKNRVLAISNSQGGVAGTSCFQEYSEAILKEKKSKDKTSSRGNKVAWLAAGAIVAGIAMVANRNSWGELVAVGGIVGIGVGISIMNVEFPRIADWEIAQRYLLEARQKNGPQIQIIHQRIKNQTGKDATAEEISRVILENDQSRLYCTGRLYSASEIRDNAAAYFR